MPVFMVASEKSNADLGKKIEEEFPDTDHYILANNQWLIDAELTTGGIADKLEIGESDARTVIFRVAEYSGRHKQSLWEWMKLD